MYGLQRMKVSKRNKSNENEVVGRSEDGVEKGGRVAVMRW